MRSKENYSPFIASAFGLTLTILVVFQIYISRESDRIDQQEAADRAIAEANGRNLFTTNCSACHGMNGEGGNGPALNSRDLLSTTSDEALFSLTRTGVPGTIMPAWGQSFGGPLTDEQVTQIVAFIRSWEPTAPEVAPVVDVPDPVQGAAIYARTCIICHGNNGEGTDQAPALNDPNQLNRFDDAWYRNTIARGRPAKGMPTWGTVLSPSQINDVVALLAAWREGETILDDIPLSVYISNALFAVRDFDRVDAEYYLNQALVKANDTQAEEIQLILGLVQDNQLFLAEGRIASLLPPEEMGQAFYTSNCASCHALNGTGGLGPSLYNNAYVQSQDDDELIAFLLTGRTGTAMNGFQGVLTEEELQTVIILLRSWQD